MGYFYCSESLNWAAQNKRLGHMRPVDHRVGIADLE